VRSISKLTGTDRLHFVPIPYPSQLIADYLPATLNHDDYPELIASGETVDTVAVSAVLFAYGWPKTMSTATGGSSGSWRRSFRGLVSFSGRLVTRNGTTSTSRPPCRAGHASTRRRRGSTVTCRVRRAPPAPPLPSQQRRQQVRPVAVIFRVGEGACREPGSTSNKEDLAGAAPRRAFLYCNAELVF
jgi:hypothetical protein